MKKIYLALLIVLSLSSVRLLAQCTTPSTTPYYENFEGITTTNQLPVCWSASNPGVTCLTFTNGGFSGNKFAAFYYSPSGSSYFYSMAIQLNAGVTYSASAWYMVSSNSGITWTDLSMFIGPNQNTTGHVPIASTNGNVLNMTYSALSNTFTVASTGVYYLAMRATSNGSASGSQFLSWDDLAVTVPCTPAFNTPNVTIAVNSNTVCNGSVITATAGGAHLYNWPGGGATTTYTVSSFSWNFLSVVGTNTLTGCSKTASLQLVVNPSPSGMVLTNKPSVCIGSSATLTALGSNNYTYTWSDGQQGSSISVSPTVTTMYSVITLATNGCTATASQQISVMPLPVITVGSSVTGTICSGEEVTLTAAGGVTYQWNSNTSTHVGSTITFPAGATTTFTVMGTDASSCTGLASHVLQVNGCTGLSSVSEGKSTVTIYPNPGNGSYRIESGNTDLKSVLVTDLIGKTIFASSGSEEQIQINIHDFANGIYNVKVSSESGTYYLKIVKE